jgi:Zn-dependent protease with chaperone function
MRAVRSIPLASGTQSRAGVIAIGAVGIVLTVAFAAAALGPHTVAGETVEELALALASLLGFGWWAGRVERRNRPGPRALTVADDQLVIAHPVALERPLTLPRNAIRAIQIDATGDPTGRHPVRRAFSWSSPTPVPDGLAGALWTPDDVPDDVVLIGAAKDAPNLAIVLDHPIVGQGMRRDRGLEHEPVIALLVCTVDPEAAATTLAEWDDVVVAELRTDHFEPRVRVPAPAATAAPAEHAAPVADAPPVPAEHATPVDEAQPAHTPRRPSVPPPAPRYDRAALTLPTPASPARNQATAVLLALGFVVPFTLITVGLLFFGGLWFVSHGPSIPAITMLIVGAGLVRVAWPRSQAPLGVPVPLADAPELHGLVAETAAAIGTTPPREIRTELSANASTNGKALVLGMSLIAGLDRDQLRAVIAHELAHTHLRHAAAQRWIGTTLQTVGRLHVFLSAMEKRVLFAGMLSAPLRHAAGGYLRLATPAARKLSAGREVAADELAARIAGPAATAAALERLFGLDIATSDWFRATLIPALEAGTRPPVVAGLVAHFDAPETRAVIAAVAANGRHDTTLRPGASHPPLGARLAIVRDVPSPARAADHRPAAGLLPDRTLDALEQALLARLAGPDRVARLAAARAAA